MERVKVFYACQDPSLLEQQINQWLEAEQPEITRVLQNASGRMDQKVVVSIFYTKK